MGEVAAPERGQNSQQASSATLKGPVLAKLGSGCWRDSNEPLYPYLVVCTLIYAFVSHILCEVLKLSQILRVITF